MNWSPAQKPDVPVHCSLTHEAYGYIGRYEYGYCMESRPAECNGEAKESGYSDALCQLVNALHGAGFYYVAFDRDAEALEGFEIFDW